ncbi:hypothetical protein OG422_31125 (plasmid) [Streptomyces sp. NBC_01525]|uniref:hypothetical protein n=1 Tax=Streptomyces sp. NBC_01525 TaxID=2903893 RepID=UPI002F91B1C0
MNATAALTALYLDSAARLTGHVAALLAGDDHPHLDVQHDDVTQEVWLRAAQQDPLPDWLWLEEEVTQIIEEMVVVAVGRQEELVGPRRLSEAAVVENFTEPILDSLSYRPAARTTEDFRAEHGDLAGWNSVDFEVFENLARMQPKPKAEVIDFRPLRPAASLARQARHALTALARTTPGRRRLIRDCAETYLSQVERRALPVGYDQPITSDVANRVDAYRMRGGSQFARMLGVSCRPANEDLPATARAVIAALDAPVDALTAVAIRTQDPAGTAVAWIVAGALTAQVSDEFAHGLAAA